MISLTKVNSVPIDKISPNNNNSTPMVFFSIFMFKGRGFIKLYLTDSVANKHFYILMS